MNEMACKHDDLNNLNGGQNLLSQIWSVMVLVDVIKPEF